MDKRFAYFKNKGKNKKKFVTGAFLLGFLLLVFGVCMFRFVIPLQKDAFKPYWADYTELWLAKGDTVMQNFSLDGHLYTGFTLQVKKTEAAEGEISINIRAADTDEVVYRNTFDLRTISKECISAAFPDAVNCEGYLFELSVLQLEPGSGFAVLAAGQEHSGLSWNGYQKDYGIVLTNACIYRFVDFGAVYLIYIFLCGYVYLFLFRPKYQMSEKWLYRAAEETLFWAAVFCTIGGVWFYAQAKIADRAVQRTLLFDAVNGSSNDVCDSQSGEAVFQTFCSPAYKMDGIRFSVQTGEERQEGELAVLLTENASQEILYDKIVPLHTCINGEVDIRFDAVSCEPWHQQYTVSLTYLSVDGLDAEISFLCTNAENHSAQMLAGGQAADSNLLLKTASSSHPYFTRYFQLVFVLLAGAVIVFVVYIRYQAVPFLLVFASSAIVLGIVYSLIFLPYCVEDEWSHFGMAYDLSNSFLGIESGYENYDWESSYFSYSMRKEDWLTYLTSNVDLDRGEYIWQQLGGKVSDDEMTQGRVFYVLTIRLPYLPSALGITAARVLRYNTYTLFYMGRLFNLLFHVFLLCISMKLCRKGRELIYAVFLIPIYTYLLMSYSYDGITICSIILFICYVLHVNQKKKIRLYHIVIMMMLMLYMISLKAGVYFPMAFCFLLVSNNKFDNKRKCFWFRAGLSVYAFIAFLGTYIWRAGQREVSISIRSEILRQPTVVYYLQRLDQTLDMFVNTMIHGIIDGILDLFGRRLSNWYHVPSMVIILVMICFFFLVQRCSILSGKRERIVIGCATAAGFLSVTAGQAVLTPVGSDFIMFAGRYLCPLLFGAGLLFSTKTAKIKPEFWLLFLLLLNATAVLIGASTMYADGTAIM